MAHMHDWRYDAATDSGVCACGERVTSQQGFRLRDTWPTFTDLFRKNWIRVDPSSVSMRGDLAANVPSRVTSGRERMTY